MGVRDKHSLDLVFALFALQHTPDGHCQSRAQGRARNPVIVARIFADMAHVGRRRSRQKQQG